MEDPRTWLSVHDYRNKTAFNKSSDERIKRILQDSFERRWRSGWGIMTERIVEWRVLQDVGKEMILSLLNFGKWLEPLLGLFEERDILSWAEAIDDIWADAEREVRSVLGLFWPAPGLINRLTDLSIDLNLQSDPPD